MTALLTFVDAPLEKHHTPPPSQNGTNSAGVLSYITRGSPTDRFVEIERLIWLVLHQDCRREMLELRFAGYTGAPVPWGVSWGGAERMLFEKNLDLRFRFGARGCRLDLRQGNIARQARRMKHIFRLHSNSEEISITQRIQLPSLWAAFEKTVAETITGDGPEFSGMCHITGQSSSELLASSKLSLGSYIAFPLDWVSHVWEQIAQIYADLRGFPHFQVVPFEESGTSLAGYRGACEFDFYQSRFTGRLIPPGSRLSKHF